MTRGSDFLRSALKASDVNVTVPTRKNHVHLPFFIESDSGESTAWSGTG
jgi:hypothetical protein